MAANSYTEFGFGSGDENIRNSKFERFTAKAGETYRISFLWWDMVDGRPNLKADSPRFVAAKRFYIPNAGYILDRGPEYAKLAGGPSKQMVATVIAIWPTDRKGVIDKEQILKQVVEVKAWVFSLEKYEQLKRRHQEFPVGQFDMTLTCTDAQYQKMDISPCRESLFQKILDADSKKDFANSILDRVEAIVGANDKGEPVGICSIIGQDMPLDRLREKLGGTPATLSSTGTSTIEVDNILDDMGIE